MFAVFILTLLSNEQQWRIIRHQSGCVIQLGIPFWSLRNIGFLVLGESYYGMDFRKAAAREARLGGHGIIVA
jgi:hypothetical protein